MKYVAVALLALWLVGPVLIEEMLVEEADKIRATFQWFFSLFFICSLYVWGISKEID